MPEIITLPVPGMTCGTCQRAGIEAAIAEAGYEVAGAQRGGSS
jgi:hypothetical protein